MNKYTGWRVVLAGGTLQFLQSMMLNQAFGAYVPALIHEYGWSKTALSGAAALRSTEAALIGPLLGWLVDRVGSQRVVRVGVALFGTGFMLLSQINSLTTFYLAFVVLALGASMCSNMIVSVAIIHWFEKHRARALSAVQFGSAVGGLFVFLVAWSIESFGWRITAFASGVIILAGGLPLAATIRNRPEDHHEPIDGMLPKVATGGAVGASSHRARRAFTTSEALRTRAFWLLSAGHACSLFVVSAITVHAISHIKEDLGYSLAQASFYITLVTAGQFAGVICGWGIGEKYDKRKVAAACMLMHAAGMLMLTYAPNIYVLVISGLVHGMAWGLRGPFMQAIRADYFGSSSIGMIMGLSSLIMVIGQVGGPILAGALADWYGNYRLGFTILAALAGIGSIFFWMAKRPQ